MQAWLLANVRHYFAEFPYLQFPDTPEASYLGAPVSVLGTNFDEPLQSRFHGFRGLGERPQRAAILPSYVVLVITTLPTTRKIRQSDKLCTSYLEMSESISGLAAHRLIKGTGILTSFPGSCLPVEDTLRIG